MTGDLDPTHWFVTRNSGFFLSKKLRNFTGISNIIPEFSLDNVGILCKTIRMSDSNFFTSYFVNNSVLKSQPQFSLRPCFEFLAKFQNMSVTEVSNVRNIGELNNVNYYFVNCEVNNYVMSVNAILEVSYEQGQQTDHVMSVNAILEVSYEQGQQTDHVPTVLEISITPMKLVTDFSEAGNGFFGVVCNKVMQEIFRTDCVNVSNMEDVKNAQMQLVETLESSTLKNVSNPFETSESSTFKNVSNLVETLQSSTFKNVSTTNSAMNVETSESSTFKNVSNLVETSQSSTFKNVSTTNSAMNVETSESSTFKNVSIPESAIIAHKQLVETLESSTLRNVSNPVETLESSTCNNVSNFVETLESSTFNVSNFVETSQSSTFNFISTLESAKNAQVQNIKTSKYFTFKNVTFQTIGTSKSLMYISTVIVDKQHYLFHAATAAAGRVVHKKIKCVKRIIHIKKVVHKKIKCVKGFIHNKTFPVKISIGNCRCGAGIKHVQKIGRLFFQKGYEFSDNVTETAVDGGANLIFQNGSYIKISKAMVDANLIFQNGSHIKISKAMVDGDANFIIQDGSDIRMSEGGGVKHYSP